MNRRLAANPGNDKNGEKLTIAECLMPDQVCRVRSWKGAEPERIQWSIGNLVGILYCSLESLIFLPESSLAQGQDECQKHANSLF